MMNGKEKTIKYRIRTGSQWLLISLLTTSTILPGITTTAYASTKESTISQNSDMSQAEEPEKILEDNENIYTNEEKKSENLVEDDDNKLESLSAVQEDETDIDKSAKESDDIASGVFGTSNWRIDSEWVLHFYEGEFDNSEYSVPWLRYRENILKIKFEGPVEAHPNSSGLFRNMPKVSSFINISYLDVSNVTNMRLMFGGMESLTSIDVSHFDTSKVTNMRDMFYGLKQLTSLDISNFDTSNVTNMAWMFYDMHKVSSLDLSNFDTSKVTDMSLMFYGLKQLTSLDISNFDTSNVTNMGHMFFGSGSLPSLDLSNFDTSKVTNMGYMFSNTQTQSLDLSNFDTSKVTNMGYMFSNTQTQSLDLSNFDTSKVTNMEGMFYQAKTQTLDLSNFDTSKVTNMNAMFREMSNLSKIALSPKLKFLSFADFPEAPSDKPYTGNWMNIGDGRINSQSRKYVYSSEELQTQYNGMDMADTYVWESDLSALNVHNSNVYVGDEWKAEDNFDSALDKDGNKVEFKDLTVDDSKVDLNTPGTYEVTYSYDGLTSTAKVTVLEVEVEQDLARIVVHNSELKVGDNWAPQDNFDEATSFDGKEVNFSDVMVSGTVDTKKSGVYEVTYSIPEEHWGRDIAEGHHTATAKIVVSEEKVNDDRNPNSKAEDSDSDKDNSSSTGNTSRENDYQNTKGLPKTGEHTSALIFMMGIALLVLGSIFSVLRVKKNKK